MKVFRLGLGVFGVAVAAGVLMFGVLGFGTAGAAPGPGGGGGGNRLGDMQAALAAKLNISVVTLQAAQTAARTQVINDAVGAGKLTQAQANALLNGPHPGTPGATPGTPGTPGQPKGQKGPKGPRPNFTGLMEIMKNYQTVLAQKLGVTPQALQTAQMAARDQLLQDAVTAGKLTQAQADAIKNHQHGQGGNAGPGLGGGLGKGIRDAETAAATALGMTPQDLQAQLRSGKSLAEIAQSKNIDRATLRSGILGAIQTDVNNALRDGKITSTQATDIINKASQNLDKVLDRKFTPRTPGNNQRGPRPNGQQRPSSGQPQFVQPKGA